LSKSQAILNELREKTTRMLSGKLRLDHFAATAMEVAEAFQELDRAKTFEEQRDPNECFTCAGLGAFGHGKDGKIKEKCPKCLGSGRVIQAHPPANSQELWATQSNPEGFFKKGTIVEVSRAPLKADNGRFVVGGPFPFQPRGLSTHLWTRLTKTGAKTTASDTTALRGGNAKKICDWIESGIMRIDAS
jgi:hypothetical protein